MCSKTTNFAVGIIIAVWTVVQTSFHVLFTLSGHYLYVCKIKPTHYLLVIFYLTYFYNSDCGSITLDDDGFFSKISSIKIIPKLSDISNNTDLYTIVKMVVEKAQLPKEATHALRTNFYMLIFLILDAVWLLTSFLLFAGTCFQVKRCLSLLFYCPWLVATGCVILVDVVAAAHFGLDLLKLSRTYTSWLRFIGVTNFKDFYDLNDHPSSQYIPIESSIIMCVVYCRFVILWVLNIVNFSQILNIALTAYQDKPEKENQEEVRRRRRKAADAALDLNTSESRIKSWQLFYGAIETTSSASSGSLKVNEMDFNSNTNRRKKTSFRVQATVENENNVDNFDQYISSIRTMSESNYDTANSHYMRFSDVADVLETGSRRNDKKPSVESLRNQMPWTYITANSSTADAGGADDRTFCLSDSVDQNRRRTMRSESVKESHSTAF